MRQIVNVHGAPLSSAFSEFWVLELLCLAAQSNAERLQLVGITSCQTFATRRLSMQLCKDGQMHFPRLAWVLS